MTITAPPSARWLSDDQQRVWRAWLLGSAILNERLDAAAARARPGPRRVRDPRHPLGGVRPPAADGRARRRRAPEPVAAHPHGDPHGEARPDRADHLPCRPSRRVGQPHRRRSPSSSRTPRRATSSASGATSSTPWTPRTTPPSVGRCAPSSRPRRPEPAPVAGRALPSGRSCPRLPCSSRPAPATSLNRCATWPPSSTVAAPDARLTPRRSRGPSTPPTPRSTASSRRPSPARVTSTSCSPCSTPPAPPASRSPRAARARPAPGTRSAPASSSTSAATSPRSARSTPRRGRRGSSRASSSPPCRPRPPRTGCGSGRTRRRTTAARSAG